MSAPLKLTDAQIKFARDIVAKRREAERQVSLYPSMSQLASKLGCTPRYLQKILAGKARQR